MTYIVKAKRVSGTTLPPPCRLYLALVDPIRWKIK